MKQRPTPSRRMAPRPAQFTLRPNQPDGFYAAKQLWEGELYSFVSVDGRVWMELEGDPRGFSGKDVEDLFAAPALWEYRMGTSFITRNEPIEIVRPQRSGAGA